MDENGLLDESGGILERGLDGSLKSCGVQGGLVAGLKIRQGRLCGRSGCYLTSEILGLLGGRCDRGRPGGMEG